MPARKAVCREISFRREKREPKKGGETERSDKQLHKMMPTVPKGLPRGAESAMEDMSGAEE